MQLRRHSQGFRTIANVFFHISHIVAPQIYTMPCTTECTQAGLQIVYIPLCYIKGGIPVSGNLWKKLGLTSMISTNKLLPLPSLGKWISPRKIHLQNLKITTSRGWFQTCFIFTPIWGRFPFGQIVFRWVGSTTRQITLFHRTLHLNQPITFQVRWVDQPFKWWGKQHHNLWHPCFVNSLLWGIEYNDKTMIKPQTLAYRFGLRWGMWDN